MNFNKQQEKIINTINGNIAVIASAGSGKTSTLTYRIKNMVENHGVLPSSILAITFSRKAKDNIVSISLNKNTELCEIGIVIPEETTVEE